MTPLARLYAHRKLNDHDRYLAEAVPLMHKQLLLQGKSDNAVIDVLFELFYRLQLIGRQIKNSQIHQTGVAAHKSLIAACDHASDKSKLTVDPSTDQKLAICAALDTLAKLAGLLSNKLYFESKLIAEKLVAEMKKVPV